ncbi:MAG: class I SAM-dependent methyltransferase [Pseudomonadota bacterium]
MSKSRYDDFPYPERNPADEKTRLLVGSPSDLTEVDHHCFHAQRDWSAGVNVLVAGGGTGDGLIMIAQQLSDFEIPREITYIDRSREAAKIAEERARIRGLHQIRFIVGDLLEDTSLTEYDYIDCCGVLHHLEHPEAGMARLAAVLKDGGGLGAMVYAPLGRSGVYDMQSALLTLFSKLSPDRQVEAAKTVLTHLPKTNRLSRNPFVGDHKRSASGLFDLLLHTQDQPFYADEVIELAEKSGLSFETFIAPAAYDARNFLPDDPTTRKAFERLTLHKQVRIAEELLGSLSRHVFYATKTSSRHKAFEWDDALQLIPHFNQLNGGDLARHVEGGKPIEATLYGHQFSRTFQIESASFLALIDGRRSLGAILEQAGRKKLGKSLKEDLSFLVDINQLRLSSLAAPPPQD